MKLIETNYVRSTLVKGEKVICSGHYHWFYWAKRGLVYALALAIGIVPFWLDMGVGVVVLPIIIVLCLGHLLLSLVVYLYDEMVITSHRVVLKTGFFSRDVFEMQIPKVETVIVDQTVAGRIFDYGQIACRGTGGTVSKYIEIAHPMEFRAAFQTAAKELQQGGGPEEQRDPKEEQLDQIIVLLQSLRTELRALRSAMPNGFDVKEEE